MAILGCYVKRADTRLETPGNGTTNTGTFQAQARPVDPLARRSTTTFWLDRVGTFTSPALVTSAGVTGFGGIVASWSPTTPANGRWYWRARSTAAVGGAVGVTGPYASTFSVTEEGGAGIPRSLYLYENKGVQATTIAARSLYLYENRGLQAISVGSRALYLYVNKALQLLSVLARSLYLYEATRDGEVFPWLMTTYVEVRIASGGSGTRGLAEVWIYEDLDDLAEMSRVWLNFGQPAVTDLGIVLWANRSPGLYTANSGVPITKAATVTLPAAAVSGLVIVREET